MLKEVLCEVILSTLVLSATAGIAQTEIATITFESIPGGTTLANGGQPIELQADTNVTGSLTATGEVSTDSGVRFPDGSIQVTAGAAGAGVTANQGLYSNTIADIMPPNAYTEVCFKGGAMTFDIHAAGEPTTGDNCVPGDTGWIIERFERNGGVASDWTTARAACLMTGMRLPELFEIQFSCDNADLLAVVDLPDGDSEWATNQAVADSLTTTVFGSAGLATMPNNCDGFKFLWIGVSNNARAEAPYRCLR